VAHAPARVPALEDGLDSLYSAPSRTRGGVRELLTGFAWGYAHLAIFAGLTAVAVGIELAIGEATEG
jgi:low temperature requirement protein LtrA